MHNFTGYAIDYETAPAGSWDSVALAQETDGMLSFVSKFSAALKAVGKDLIVDMGGTTVCSLSTQGCSCNQTAACTYQSALLRRWAATGATLMEMGTCKPCSLYHKSNTLLLFARSASRICESQIMARTLDSIGWSLTMPCSMASPLICSAPESVRLQLRAVVAASAPTAAVAAVRKMPAAAQRRTHGLRSHPMAHQLASVHRVASVGP